MATDQLTATIHPSTADIPAAVWNGLVPSSNGRPDNPFTDHRFFVALEESGCATRRTGWQPQHILLADQSGRAAGLMPLFLKSHSMGEYVFDHGWADAFERAGGSYYPKLQCSIPFTPVTASKLWTGDGGEGLKRALLTTAETLALRVNASSVHATFMPEDEAEAARHAGWLERTDTQFHWHNNGFSSFEDYLDTMSSRHRKVVRRERRDALADGLSVKWLSGADLTEAAWDAFYEFYEDTGSRKWGRPYLNRKFFSLLGETMAEQVVLILAYDGHHPIAGALNLKGKDTLYGRNWGAIRHVPFLHFEICYYQAIDYAIANGLRTVEAGAQGDHKLARGYVPTTTRSMHWIGNPGFRGAVSDYLARERMAVLREQENLDHYTPFRKGDPQG